MEDKEWIKFLKDRKIIAIDPGKEGGIVVFSLDKNEFVEVIHMPETPQFLEEFLNKYKNNSICYLEKVGGLPGMGGSSMFNFGKGFGHLEMESANGVKSSGIATSLGFASISMVNVGGDSNFYNEDQAIPHNFWDLVSNQVNYQPVVVGHTSEKLGEIFNDYATNSAMAPYSHCEGYKNISSENYSHVEGEQSSALSEATHCEGKQNKAILLASHSEGITTIASGMAAHAEGEMTRAMDNFSHAEGLQSSASSQGAHSEGSFTIANNTAAHAEGNSCLAEGKYSHSEGSLNTVSGQSSHAEGSSNRVSGSCSHAEGFNNVIGSSFKYAHVEGSYNIVSGDNQHIMGTYNKPMTNNCAFIIGNGSSDTSRNNCLTVDNYGNMVLEGELTDTKTYAIYESTEAILVLTGRSQCIYVGSTSVDVTEIRANGFYKIGDTLTIFGNGTFMIGSKTFTIKDTESSVLKLFYDGNRFCYYV